jgi:hypothetical protein
MGANQAGLLDVRWLAARVRREKGAALAGAAGTSSGAIALGDGVAVTKRWQTKDVAEPKGVRLPEGWLPERQVEKPGALPSVKELDDAQR